MIDYLGIGCFLGCLIFVYKLTEAKNRKWESLYASVAGLMFILTLFLVFESVTEHQKRDEMRAKAKTANHLTIKR
ncbi:MAG: hypothetical protein WCT25_04255 [Candidatus Paceibacterota bacterium]